MAQLARKDGDTYPVVVDDGAQAMGDGQQGRRGELSVTSPVIRDRAQLDYVWFYLLSDGLADELVGCVVDASGGLECRG